MEAFELRLWDGRIGRWFTIDPYHEFFSPYVGMGNNPINLIDPDGGSTEPPTEPGTCAGDIWYDVQGGASYEWDGANWHSDMGGNHQLEGVVLGTNVNTRLNFFEVDSGRSRRQLPGEYMKTNTPWMTLAESQIGIQELTNNNDGIDVEKYLQSCGLKKGQPWCAAFVNWTLEESGIEGVKVNPAYSLNWNTWGQGLSEPAYGAIATMKRKGGGHIGFVAGKTPSGRIILLGGNQSDMVKLESFKASKILHYRYPEGYTPSQNALPIISNINVNTKMN
jgi:uncharacterized protein (TIGR02594 family)